MFRRRPKPAPTPTAAASSARFVLAYMASLSVLALLSFFLFSSISSAARRNTHNPSARLTLDLSSSSAAAAIKQACGATRFPATCASSLAKSGRVRANPTATQIILAAISLSADNVAVARSMASKILAASVGNPNRTTAANNCGEVLANSNYRTASSAEALGRGGALKNARAWLSASLHYQYACQSGLSYVTGTSLVKDTMSFLDATLELTSNALSMASALDNYGDDTASWLAPETERQGFWEAPRAVRKGVAFARKIPPASAARARVCSGGGSGCYPTVQAAVDSAPSNGTDYHVIYISAGIYREIVRVPLFKTNLVFLGDGMGKTVITGSLSVADAGYTTYNTPTIAVLGDRFTMSKLTVENTAGPNAHQAVALRVDSDQAYIVECELLGNQDTLFANSLRQYYQNCRIEGNVDFIFGNSASVFDGCDILIRPRQLKPASGGNNAVTAQGRTDLAQSTGLVFQGCRINGTDEYMKYYTAKPSRHRAFLGRPWKQFSRTVFIGCELGEVISPEGWLPWKGNFALDTLYYGEYGNEGPGANRAGRVTWSSVIPADRVTAYSLPNFIQADQWGSS